MGTIQIPITTITPTIPIAFFRMLLHPITVSTASPSIFPTTGIKFDTAALAVFAVIPSTLLDKLPSSDNIPTNSVSIIPNAHIVVLLKYFDILFICTLSDTFEIIPSAVPININGKKTLVIIFPIKLIKNNNIGWAILADVMFPVVIINVIKIGIKLP